MAVQSLPRCSVTMLTLCYRLAAHDRIREASNKVSMLHTQRFEPFDELLADFAQMKAGDDSTKATAARANLQTFWDMTVLQVGLENHRLYMYF